MNEMLQRALQYVAARIAILLRPRIAICCSAHRNMLQRALQFAAAGYLLAASEHPQ
jgi:hypothetical protein